MSELECRHGRLRRQCNECDLEQENQQQAETIKQLQQEKEMLEARVGRLDRLVDDYYNELNEALIQSNMVTPQTPQVKAQVEHLREKKAAVGLALFETPQQSLVAIAENLTLDRPGKIGHMKFGKGVPWRLVVECAQRQFAQADKG